MDSAVPIPLLGLALDDLWLLRGAAAYESARLRELAAMKTMPVAGVEVCARAAGLLEEVARARAHALTQLEPLIGTTLADSAVRFVTGEQWRTRAQQHGGTYPTQETVPARVFDRAVEEVSGAVQVFATVATWLQDLLTVRRLPGRRLVTSSMERMSEAAGGQVDRAYAMVGSLALQQALRALGAPVHLTRSIFEEQAA